MKKMAVISRFCSSYSCRDTQKWELELSGKRLHRSGLAHSLSEVTFLPHSLSEVTFLMLHQLHSLAKDPQQGNPCSGANKTLSSFLTAVLTKISSKDCCSQDHQLT